MSKADLVGDYFGRLTQKHIGRPIYIRQKGAHRDEIMEGVISMCKLMNIPYEVMSPARIRRIKPIIMGVDPAAKGFSQSNMQAQTHAAIAKAVAHTYNSGGRSAYKTAMQDAMIKNALINGQSVLRIHRDGTKELLTP